MKSLTIHRGKRLGPALIPLVRSSFAVSSQDLRDWQRVERVGRVDETGFVSGCRNFGRGEVRVGGV
jgi:hypothetical protein